MPDSAPSLLKRGRRSARGGAGRSPRRSLRELDLLATAAFSARLRERMAALELTTGEIAELLDVGRQHAHRLVRGERCPTIGALCALAALVEMPLDDLLGLESARAETAP